MNTQTAVTVADEAIYADHLAEVGRLRKAGVYDIESVALPGMDYGSLAGAESVGEEVHYLFSGSFDEIVRDVLNILAARIALDNRMKGFWPDGTDAKDTLKLALYPETKGRNPGEALALGHSEFSESLEAIRSSENGGFEVMDDKLPHRSGFGTEIIDAIIRGLDMTGGFDLKPGDILVEKLARNRARPYKHGRAF